MRQSTAKRGVITDTSTRFAVTNTRLVADVATGQLAKLPKSMFRSVSDLLLNDSFAIGYMVGFAEQGSRHANKGRHGSLCYDYTRSVFEHVLENASDAQSFVSFARFQQGDAVFENGHRRGVADLNGWLSSHGRQQPVSLHDQLSGISSEAMVFGID